jgi:hypothetical protein
MTMHSKPQSRPDPVAVEFAFAMANRTATHVRQEKAMTVLFPELAQLLEYDQNKVQRVVWEFYRSATKDLHCLEQAVVAHQWQVARDLARRIQVSCLQVGERDAAEAAATLVCIPGEFLAEAYGRHQPRIAHSLERAEQFVALRISGRMTWPEETDVTDSGCQASIRSD